MLHERYELPVRYEGRLSNNNFRPYLKTYILDNFNEYNKTLKRPVVVICPGGAYGFHSEREGEAVAIKMNSLGFHAVIVWYSLAPMEFPCALIDLCEAVNFVRENADRWNINSEKVVVAGFSAGGHLAASLGVYWNSDLVKSYLPYKSSSLKPNGLMLAYPVITTGKLTHADSIRNVLGCSERYGEDDVRLEDHVTENVPPVFMWHTYEDTLVPVENSMLFAQACRNSGVPLEYHVFRRGIHGLSLASKETSWNDGKDKNGIQKECQVWPELFAMWMDSL